MDTELNAVVSPIYKNLDINHGLIGVMGVDYDEVSKEVPVMPKGKDGNAKKEDPLKLF